MLLRPRLAAAPALGGRLLFDVLASETVAPSSAGGASGLGIGLLVSGRPFVHCVPPGLLLAEGAPSSSGRPRDRCLGVRVDRRPSQGASSSRGLEQWLRTRPVRTIARRCGIACPVSG